MALRHFKFDEVTISFPSPEDNTDLDKCKRDALYDWLEDNSVTISFVQMGDETSDVFLLFNGMELASSVKSDYDEFMIAELKSDLFETFINTNLQNFDEIDELDIVDE